MKKKIKLFDPIIDESEEKSIIKQHQMVYQALGDMMRQEIHALSMKTLTPKQWKNN